MKVLRIQRDQVDDHSVELILVGRIVAAWADLLEHEAIAVDRTTQ